MKNRYGAFSSDQLIALTYKEYPYYAINSTIAGKFLTVHELEKMKKLLPLSENIILFTIGYEGISLEEFLNKLIINNIKVLCDVRKNPLSMKFGFSKDQLRKACSGVDIGYIHIPEVGIESDKRQKLITQTDYDKLFIYYKEHILSKEIKRQAELFDLLVNKKRIALTCFEANIHQCHRKHLAESISRLDGFKYEINHL